LLDGLRFEAMRGQQGGRLLQRSERLHDLGQILGDAVDG
jgi:hypothetical protein